MAQKHGPGRPLSSKPNDPLISISSRVESSIVQHFQNNRVPLSQVIRELLKLKMEQDLSEKQALANRFQELTNTRSAIDIEIALITQKLLQPSTYSEQQNPETQKQQLSLSEAKERAIATAKLFPAKIRLSKHRMEDAVEQLFQNNPHIPKTRYKEYLVYYP